MKSVANSFYRLAIRQSAKTLFETNHVKGIALRGGALQNPVPGVSDIDLTIFIDDELSHSELADLLLTLREKTLKLKRRFPMLGEILLLNAFDIHLLELSGNSLMTLIQPQVTLRGRAIPISSRSAIPDEARLILCLHYYNQMLSEYYQMVRKGSKAFHKARCLRYASKIFRTCSAKGGGSDFLPEVFASALLTVHELSVKVLSESRRNPSLHSIELQQWNNCPDTNAQEEKDSFRWWTSASFWMRHFGRVISTGEPLIFLWDGPIETKPLVAFFEFYPRSLEKLPNAPVLLTPAMEECRLFGLSNEALTHYTERVPAEKATDPRWMDCFRSHLLYKAKDRLLVNLSLLPFNFMSSEPETILIQIREVCELAVTIQSGQSRQNPVELIPEVALTLPLTCALYRRILSKTVNPLAKNLLEEFFAARAEMIKLLFSYRHTGSHPV